MATSTSTGPTGAEAGGAPACPLTGAPAAALLQRIPAKLLHDLWRHGARVDPAPLRRDQGGIGLWRSPCGLAFFHPPVEGSAGFYEAFHARHRVHEQLGAAPATRPDFQAAAALLRPGDHVLEVGCGRGAFAAVLPPGTRYQGLEPHGAPPPGGPPILAEGLAAHAARHAGAYDLACAFHVIEHVADPRGFAAAMAACLRPGGTLVLAMPLWPSAYTEIPNNLMNLPPHHLTWWTAEAAHALCAAAGLDPLRIGPLPLAPMQARLAWARRLCPVRTRPGEWVRPRWSWHLAALWALLAGGAAARLLGLPRGAPPADLLVVARKPG